VTANGFNGLLDGTLNASLILVCEELFDLLSALHGGEVSGSEGDDAVQQELSVAELLLEVVPRVANKVPANFTACSSRGYAHDRDVKVLVANFAAAHGVLDGLLQQLGLLGQRDGTQGANLVFGSAGVFVQLDHSVVLSLVSVAHDDLENDVTQVSSQGGLVLHVSLEAFLGLSSDLLVRGEVVDDDSAQQLVKIVLAWNCVPTQLLVDGLEQLGNELLKARIGLLGREDGLNFTEVGAQVGPNGVLLLVSELLSKCKSLRQ
jgi:hypothetical protein